MRFLRKYIHRSQADDNEVETERREILKEYEDTKEALLNGCSGGIDTLYEIIDKRVKRAYEFAKQYGILSFRESEVIERCIRAQTCMWQIYGDIRKYANRRFGFSLTTQMYSAIRQKQWRSMQCDINMQTFLFFDENVFTINARKLTLYHEYKRVNLPSELLYNMRHGPCICDNERIRFGANVISLYETPSVLNIYGCHIVCRLGSHVFRYHICTNTLRYGIRISATEPYCSCARTQELWCRRNILLRKYRKIMMKITKKQDFPLSREEVIVHNFL